MISWLVLVFELNHGKYELHYYSTGYVYTLYKFIYLPNRVSTEYKSTVLQVLQYIMKVTYWYSSVQYCAVSYCTRISRISTICYIFECFGYSISRILKSSVTSSVLALWVRTIFWFGKGSRISSKYCTAKNLHVSITIALTFVSPVLRICPPGQIKLYINS